jgi:hypothetical protein
LRRTSCAGMLSPIPRWDRWVGSLVSRRIPAGLVFASDGGLPQVRDGSAPTTKISGPHREFTRVTAYLLAGPQDGPLHRRLRRLRYLRRRSDCYRLERPRYRAGFAPAEDPHLFTAHPDPFPPPTRPFTGVRPARATPSNTAPSTCPARGPTASRPAARGRARPACPLLRPGPAVCRRH